MELIVGLSYWATTHSVSPSLGLEGVILTWSASAAEVASKAIALATTNEPAIALTPQVVGQLKQRIL